MMNRFFTLLLAASCLTAVGQETGCTFELADNYQAEAIVDDGSCTFGGGVYIDPVVVSTALFDPCGGDGLLRDESITSTNWNYEAYRQALTDHIENVGFGRVFVVEMHQEVMSPEFQGYGFNRENFPDPAWYVSCAYSAYYAEWIPSVTIAFSDPCLFSSCLGCADSIALNFEPSASIDDGSCIYSSDACGEGTIWDPISQTCIVDESACGWQPDGNGDNLIGVNDLLDLLGVYGDTDYDQDGIWDSADDCVGEYDECGVCNGSGPSYLTIENIEILIDSVYVEQIDQWLTFEIGADTTFALSCEWQCGLPWEYQGYHYQTVQIGDQCWFAENLRCESYRNGGLIQTGSEGAWFNTNMGMTAVYGEGVSTCTAIVPEFEACDEDSALSYLGRLYNGHAIHDDRGLCPVGWSVPMNEDWDVLFSFLGGSSTAGAELKSEELWSTGHHGTNSSGFNGLPGGGRGYTGVFFGAGENGYYWSASPAGAQGYVKVLLPTSDIGGGILDKNYGFSVRCIKDSE